MSTKADTTLDTTQYGKSYFKFDIQTLNKFFLFLSALLCIYIAGSIIYNSLNRSSVLTSLEDFEHDAASEDEKGYFELNNFDRFEVKDGNMSWRIFADKARYYASQKLTQITKAKLRFNRSDGSFFYVFADKAKIFTDDAELEGNVRLELSNGVNVYSHYAVYDSANAKVTIPQDAEVVGDGFNVKSAIVDVFVDKKYVYARGNVKSKFAQGSNKVSLKKYVK